MEEQLERQFFDALHQYIQRVVSENPKGPVNLNVIESSARADMVSALTHIIDARIKAAFDHRDFKDRIAM